MKLNWTMAVVCAALTVNVYAQTEEVSSEKKKKVSHEFALQVNELLKQTINLSNNNTPVNNNYVLKYGMFFNRSTIGIRVGLGYFYDFISDKDGRESYGNAIFYRLGMAKRVSVSKKLELDWGFDLLNSRERNKTFDQAVLGADSNSSTVNTKISTYGGGPQISLSYAFSKHFLIGTEASYYFLYAFNKENVEVISNRLDLNTGKRKITTTVDNEDTKAAGIAFQAPVALYFIVRF